MTPITDGTLKFVVTKSGGVLPGTVTAFSGTVNDGYPVNKNTGLVDKEWHLCDGSNGSAPVTANDLRGVIAAAAVRSNALHIKYNELKQRVNAAETVDDVNNITWPED